MPVSELEKKAESMMRTISATKSTFGEMSSNEGLPIRKMAGYLDPLFKWVQGS